MWHFCIISISVIVSYVSFYKFTCIVGEIQCIVNKILVHLNRLPFSRSPFYKWIFLFASIELNTIIKIILVFLGFVFCVIEIICKETLQLFFKMLNLNQQLNVNGQLKTWTQIFKTQIQILILNFISTPILVGLLCYKYEFALKITQLQLG